MFTEKDFTVSIEYCDYAENPREWGNIDTMVSVSRNRNYGADESTKHLHLIKGGGGALTREKIVAGASDKFICIADDSKLVDVLGEFPLPIEVIPMAQSLVARQIVALGGKPILRKGFTTDNGNIILDVHNLEIINPVEIEEKINQWAGVVTVGIFAHRPADVLILGGESGISTYS